MPKKKEEAKPHTKPTKEELDANIKKATEELDEMAKKPETTPVEEPEVVKETKPSKPAPEVEPEPEPATEPEDDIVTDEPVETPEAPDFKKKFTESTREAQVLHAKNKKLREVMTTAGKISEPTEEELAKEFTDWDVMSDFEKKMARETMLSTRRFAAIEEANKEFDDIDAWGEKVDGYVADPKTLADNPELDGREDEFKTFATKPSRRGVDFEDLVPAFLFSIEKSAKPKNKGAMFETGTGGPNDKSKAEDGKISVDEARELRETNYKEYRKLTKADKVRLDDI